MLTNIQWCHYGSIEVENANEIQAGKPVSITSQTRKRFVNNIIEALTVNPSNLPRLSNRIIHMFHEAHASDFSMENEIKSLRSQSEEADVVLFHVVLAKVVKYETKGGGMLYPNIRNPPPKQPIYYPNISPPKQPIYYPNISPPKKPYSSKKKPISPPKKPIYPNIYPNNSLGLSVQGQQKTLHPSPTKQRGNTTKDTHPWVNPRSIKPKTKDRLTAALTAYAFDSYCLNTYLLIAALPESDSNNQQLDKLEKEAIYNYNAVNRNIKEINSINDFIEQLNNDFVTHGKFMGGLQVFRGQTMPFIATTEDVFMATPEKPIKFRCPTYISTSSDQQQAKQFLDNICCVMTIDIGADVKALNMDDFSNNTFDNEKEVLINKGYIIQVDDVSYNPDLQRFVMSAKVVPDTEDKGVSDMFPTMDTISTFNGTNTTFNGTNTTFNRTNTTFNGTDDMLKTTYTSIKRQYMTDSRSSSYGDKEILQNRERTDVENKITLSEHNQSLSIKFYYKTNRHNNRYAGLGSESSTESSPLIKFFPADRGNYNRYGQSSPDSDSRSIPDIFPFKPAPYPPPGPRYGGYDSDSSGSGGGARRQGFVTAMTAVLGLAVVVTAMVPR